MSNYYMESDDIVAYWDRRHIEWDKNPNISIFAEKLSWFNIRFDHILPVPLEPIGRVLDYGCGCGMYSPALLRRFAKYRGVDTSRKAVEIAVRYFGHQKNWRVMQIDPGQTLPFPDQFFDCAISITCLQHLPIPLRLAAIQEIKRVLKPGGKYVGLEMMGNTQAADMPPMSEADWLEAWKPLTLVQDVPAHNPEWALDNIWYSA